MRNEVVIKLEQGEGNDVYFRLEGREDNREKERINLFIKNAVTKTMVVPSRAKNELPGVNNKLCCLWGLGFGAHDGYSYEYMLISPPEGGGSILPEAKRLFALFVENWEVALTDQANNHKGYKPYTLK